MVKDPYRFFRVEAREILDGLVLAATRLGKDASDADSIARILRLSHTLKGAARVVRQSPIADHAHAIEDLFAGFRDGSPATPEVTAQLLQAVDAIAASLSSIDAPVPDGATKGAPVERAIPVAVSRIDSTDLEALLGDLSQARVTITALSRRQADCQQLVDRAERAGQHTVSDVLSQRTALEELATAARTLRRDFAEDLAAARTQVIRAQASGERLRLIRADDILPALERAAHDAAQACNKKVDFTARGGETRLAGDVLAIARDALQHMVRNAVVHGIEEPQSRSASGKPPSGRVELLIERRGDRIAFICRDDGRGIDRRAVITAAVANGAASPEQAKAMSAEQALRMILLPGVSTAKGVSQVSGRGIGMDVVRDAAVLLNGEVVIDSRDGLGAAITLVVPVSRSSMAAIEISCGGMVALLPRASIESAVRLGPADLVATGSGSGIAVGGRIIPCLSLAHALGSATGTVEPRDASTAVVVVDGADRIALLVDRVTRGVEVVVEPVPALAGAVPLLSGIAFDESGNLAPVLEPRSLMAQAAAGTLAVQRAHARKRVRVLVIDDSLTTRMLEQSILESAGYEVEVASSAEEGLERANREAYALFVVDVEMPGMNGFEFVATTRADAKLREIPAILVTSLSTPEHRRKGLEAGARAYIVKGEFDQGRFLDTIRSLVG